VIDVRRQIVSGTPGSDAACAAAAGNRGFDVIGSGLKKSSETFIDPR